MRACECAPDRGNMYPAGLTASSSAFHGLLSGADWLHCWLSGSACLNQGLESLRAVGKIGKGVGRDMWMGFVPTWVRRRHRL